MGLVLKLIGLHFKMRCFIAISCLVALVWSQTNPRPSPTPPAWFMNIQGIIGMMTDVVDSIHEYRFEYHAPVSGTHLLIAIKDIPPPKECHFIEVAPSWEYLFNDTAKLQVMAVEVYAIIHNNGTRETEMKLSSKQFQAKNTKKSFCILSNVMENVTK